MWEISGYTMSTPAMHRLFKLTAVSDKENTKRFSFGQASALAEHILRVVFYLTTDKVKWSLNCSILHTKYFVYVNHKHPHLILLD